jgi:hypothetical protein
MRIRVLISGRNYDALSAVPAQLDLPDGAALSDALAAIAAALPAGVALPASCLIAISGVHLGTVASRPERTLRDGEELLLIAPVAGG